MPEESTGPWDEIDPVLPASKKIMDFLIRTHPEPWTVTDLSCRAGVKKPVVIRTMRLLSNQGLALNPPGHRKRWIASNQALGVPEPELTGPFFPRSEKERLLCSVVENHFPEVINAKTILDIPEIAAMFDHDHAKIVAAMRDIRLRGGVASAAPGADRWEMLVDIDGLEAPTLMEANGIAFPVYQSPAQMIVELSSFDEAYVFVLCSTTREFYSAVKGINDVAEVLARQHEERAPFGRMGVNFKMAASGRSAWASAFYVKGGLIMVDRKNLTKIKSWHPTGFFVCSSMGKSELHQAVEWYSAKAADGCNDIRVPVTADEQRPAPTPTPQSAAQPSTYEQASMLPPDDTYPILSPSLALSERVVGELLPLMAYRVMIGEVARAYHSTFECKDKERYKGAGFCDGCAGEALVAVRAAIPAIEAYCSGALG